MRTVSIIHKAHSEQARQKAQELAAWLEARGLVAHTCHAAGGHQNNQEWQSPAFEADTELAVVLGGDGTMLGAVRQLAAQGLDRVPILGVNLGGLGFLTALAPEELFPAMDRVLGGEYHAPPRMMLRAVVERQGQEAGRLTAFNDAVINKSALARIVELKVRVGETELTTFRADGLIVATPTGSTAYNLSAGGPICHPQLDCMVLTPICSFALSNRPLLLPPEMVLEVEVGAKAQEITLTCDGQVGFHLQGGDRVRLSRSSRTVRLILSPFRDYFEILRDKLNWR